MNDSKYLKEIRISYMQSSPTTLRLYVTRLIESVALLERKLELCKEQRNAYLQSEYDLTHIDWREKIKKFDQELEELK